MISYPVTCKYCGEVFDSEDSVADSMGDLRYHIRYDHPEVDPDMKPKEVSMTLKIDKAERKPFLVDYVVVTEDNMEEAAAWCKGDIRVQTRDEVATKYVKVDVTRPANTRQTRAFVGDYILHTISGFRVYGEVAFHKSFRPPTEEDIPVELIEVSPVENAGALIPTFSEA